MTVAPALVSPAGIGPLADVAQLLLPAIRWDETHGFSGHTAMIERALELGVGGFILFGGTRDAVAALTGDLHARSRIPLLIGADLERGAGQQIAGLTGLPPLAALGSLGDREAIRHAARLTAREAKSVGINWIYGPVCDLDIEPDNPIVGTRALGPDPAQVAELAAEWIDACQAESVLACGKHFPGHGRTTGDSHMELPTVGASEAVLHEEDLVPFRAAIDAGVAALMTAHVSYPALDSTNTPATLSPRILGQLLRRTLGFDGLVVTDALIMDGILDGQDEREASVRAIAAGCDLLLYPTDLEGVARALARAIDDGRLAASTISSSAARRRRWAEWAGGAGPEPVSDDDRAWADAVCRRVVHTLRGPLPRITARTEVIIVDDDLGGPYPPPSREPFLAALAEFGVEPRDVDAPSLSEAGTVIIGVFGDIRSWKGRPGYSAPARKAVADAVACAREAGRPSIVVQFSHPRLAPELGDVPALLCAWGGEAPMQRAAAAGLLSLANGGGRV